MGFLKKIFSAPGRTHRRIRRDEENPPGVEPGFGTGDEAEEKRPAEYAVWDELDNYHTDFFLGTWASRKIRGTDEDESRPDREALARERAAAEGREYKSKLQLELEAVARKREEKEMRKAEKRRLKEERKRKA